MPRAVFVLIFAISLQFSVMASFLSGWTAPLYNQIKNETLKQAKAALTKDISIGKASGNIIGEIVFEDVNISGFCQAKRVKINYNLIELALKRDIIAAINKISIDQANFKVYRDKKDQWNVLNLPKPQQPGGPPAPAFRSKIYFTNSTVNYIDELGFKPNASTFFAKINNVKGELNIKNQDHLFFSLTALLDNQPLRLDGSFFPEINKLNLKLNAKNVKLGLWANYCLPIAGLETLDGKADVDLELFPARIRSWPIGINANYTLKQAKLEFAGFEIDRANGQINMQDDELEATINSAMVANKELNLLTSINRLDLKTNLSTAVIKGNIDLDKSTIYQQSFFGKANFDLAHKVLQLDFNKINAYQGTLSGTCALDFVPVIPNINLDAKLENFSFGAIAQNTPGLAGQINGKLSCNGPIDNFKGKLETSLKSGTLFGQKLEQLNLNFNYARGDFFIEKLQALAPTATLNANGEINKDLSCNFNAQAQGIRLAGHGILGNMSALIEDFNGDLQFKIDQKFLGAPLKYLQAHGEVVLKQGQLGEQSFDIAQGKIKIGNGIISFVDARIQQNASIIYLSGQAGIGAPTDLRIQGNRLELADLKIFNYILPDFSQNPTGEVTINLNIFGDLSAETKFLSIDPLFNLNATAEAYLSNALVADVPIKTGRLAFAWKEHRFSLSRCELAMPDSFIDLNISQEKNSQLKGRAKVLIDLALLQSITGKYGNLDGTLALNAEINGNENKPLIATSFELNKVSYNNMDFDKIEGSLNYFDQQILLPKPIIFSKANSSYILTGNMLLTNPLTIDLALEAKNSTIPKLTDLILKLEEEYYRRFSAYSDKDKINIDTSAFLFDNYANFRSKKTNVRLYSLDKKQKGYINIWETLLKQTQTKNEAQTNNLINGQINASLSLKGKVNDWQGSTSINIDGLEYKNVKFGNLIAQARLIDNSVEIIKCELSNDKTKAALSGKINLNGNLNLTLKGDYVPLNYLKPVINSDLQGFANLEAKIRGNFSDPDFALSAKSLNPSIGNLKYDRIDLLVNKNGKTLDIQKCNISHNYMVSGLSGEVTLAENGPLDLNIYLADNAIGIMNLFSDQAKWQEGKGLVKAKIEGTLDNLKIDGKISLNEVRLRLPAIESELLHITASAEIINSQLSLPRLSAIWQNQKANNNVGLAGTIDLSQALRQIKMDLTLTPGNYYINMRNLYKGGLLLKNAQLKGNYNLENGTGLTLLAKAELENAVLYLSNSNNGPKPFPLGLDLDLKIKKNVYAVMGDIWNTDLSNTFMNLEINTDFLAIHGTLAEPSLRGKLNIKRGNLSIFDRDFTLVSPEQLKKDFNFSAETAKENIAQFNGAPGKEGMVPRIILTAKTEAENIKIDTATNAQINEKIIILAHLDGLLGSSDIDQGLKIKFTGYKEENNSYLLASYSEQELKVMLLPDFLKSMIRDSNGIDNKVSSNAMVADFINNRLQALVFRGIERDLEQRLGLESLTLDYNFGKDIRKAMGDTEDTHFEQQRPDLAVGFAKGLFDRLYIDVRYFQNTNQLSNRSNNFWNYQLTYKLTPVWSIIYYRDPDTITNPSVFYQKMSLEGKYSF